MSTPTPRAREEILKLIRKTTCYFKGHKPKIADNDDWTDEKGRVPAKWTIEYCTRCYKHLRKIIL